MFDKKWITSALGSFSVKGLIISITTVIILSASVAITYYFATTAEVTLLSDDEEVTIRTSAENVDEFMDEMGVDVSRHDDLSEDLEAELEDGMVIEYTEAQTIHLTVDGESKQFYTTFAILSDFLDEQEIDILEDDLISQSTDSLIEDGMHVSIQKAFEVTIDDGGDAFTLNVTNQTVQELLAKEDVQLNELDRLNVELTSMLRDQPHVVVTRVTRGTETLEETTGFTEVTRNDNSIYRGESKVVQQGQEGKVAKKFEVIKENGEEVSRQLLSEEVVAESKEHIVAVGTKVKQSAPQLASNQSGGEVVHEFYAQATAYTAGCAGCSGFTATGINLNANPNMKVIAVDPNVIPLGSRVWVEGYGYAIAGDTGGAINGNKIDVHVASKSEAHRWGRRTVKVRVYGN